MGLQMEQLYYAIKDENGEYYYGYIHWGEQLRKAQFYSTYEVAAQSQDSIRWMDRDTRIVRIRIEEVDEYNPELLEV
jgi:hypothetical protein